MHSAYAWPVPNVVEVAHLYLSGWILNVLVSEGETLLMDSKEFKVFTVGSSGQTYYISLCTVRILRECKQNGRPWEMPLCISRQELLGICTWLVEDRYLYTSACHFAVIIS